MTIQEATQYITEELLSLYGKGEAGTMADWTIEYITGIKRSNRLFSKQNEFSALQTNQLNEIVKRLLQQEPIQYVLNEAWFFGLKLYVDKNVLIPRPETEELVEWIISNCKFPIKELSILDIGSGSGCIPVALKRKLRKAEVWSCDISNEAIEVAKRNAKNLNADINFLELDFLHEEQRNKLPSFDIIVSNPPYIPEKDKATMQPNVLQYEPATALFVPDNDPLLFYKAIADFGKQHLNKEGIIYTEIHEEFGKATEQFFQSNNYSTELKRDMQGKERMLKVTRK